MLMIDLLRLPGVEEARDRLLDDGVYVHNCTCESTAFINSLYIDDLIQAVAEAVGRETTERIKLMLTSEK